MKVIAVVGATGAQGGGLARAILGDPAGEFAVRALTRDPGSERAKELAALGAEVVEADLDAPAGLLRAFEGAHGAYVMTNFWEPRTPEQQQARTPAEMELAQAANAARAAGEAGLRHVIWSTLADTRPYFPPGDAYRVPHADSKADGDRFFAASGVPTTYLRASVYYEAFTSLFAPSRNERGELVLALGFGSARVPAQAAEDVGRTAYGIFREGTAMAGEVVSVAGSTLTGAQYAEALTTALGEPVTYQPISPEAIRASGAPGAEEVANMLTYFAAAEQDLLGTIDDALLRRLNPGLLSFPAWLENHKEAFSRI
ncbi:NmrA/HSCARG family protein [Nonomuraea sp. NPDC050790]|uniref:NmrA/HSCARG family protein n=1 Tax=Nonomuraea sp. NPDC050790 TaxID=3364371 RepID=UPI00378D450C